MFPFFAAWGGSVDTYSFDRFWYAAKKLSDKQEEIKWFVPDVLESYTFTTEPCIH